jgi:hypothetical protein
MGEDDRIDDSIRSWLEVHVKEAKENAAAGVEAGRPAKLFVERFVSTWIPVT